MSDPKQQQVFPLAPATLPRSDEESATSYRSEQAMKKKKRMKCVAYIAAFVVLQTIVIVVFSLVFLRVKTPKVRLEDVTIANTGINGSVFSFSARVAVKNTNYGRYKFDDSLAIITSTENGVLLARLAIPEARAKARSTKRILVAGELNTVDSNGNLAVSVAANLRGKVELLRIMKRKKSADMFCTMIINLPSNSVQDLACK